MQIIDQYVELVETIDGEAILWKIEAACRNCYKSEGKNSERDRSKRDALIRGAVGRSHTSVLEHGSVTFRVVTNRGVSHEWVRHRIGCSYSQESTRYCNYGHGGGEISVIWPWYLGQYRGTEGFYAHMEKEPDPKSIAWAEAMQFAENKYLHLLSLGCKPEEARGVLPNDLKTEIIVTMNIVSLRHFFELRCTKAAHPQIRDLALKLLELLNYNIPVLFEDLVDRFLLKGEGDR